jgi:hypothetical protein
MQIVSARPFSGERVRECEMLHRAPERVQ